MTGRLTASGEPFNNDELLGAHPSYPLGSMVKVTSLTNGKSVVVRIVDRGPYTPGRVINVSQSAARQLDMLRAGVVGVKLELLPSQAGPLP
jgi:rare lipoprotein A